MLYLKRVCDFFESIFEKCLRLGELCNDSRLYKNVYKVLVLKIVQRDVCFEHVSKV